MFRYVAGLLLQTLATLVLAAPAAHAAEAAPPVSFVDTTALAVAGAARDVRTPLLVRSDRENGDVFVTVRVVGPRTNALRVEPPTRGDAILAPGEEAEWTLVVPSLTADSKPMAGTVVATARGGPPARLPLKVTNIVAKPNTSDAIAATETDELTLPATNYLPSLLSPYGPPLAALAIALLVLAAVVAKRSEGDTPTLAYVLYVVGVLALFRATWVDAFGEGSDPTARWVMLGLLLGAVVLVPIGFSLRWSRGRWVIAAAAVLAVAAGVVGSIDGVMPDDPTAELIQPKPLAVTAGDGRVGTVSDDDSDVARLVVVNGELRPAGLERAGEWAGKADLGGEKPTAVKVNVRDWWLWAALVLLAGVLVGVSTRRYWDFTRGLRELEHKSGVLLDAVGRAARRAGEIGPERAPSIMSHIVTVLERAKQRQRHGNADEADELLTAAQDYHDDFQLLLERLRNLDELAGRLEGHGEQLGLNPTSVGAAVAARSAGRVHPELDPHDTGKKQLEAAVTEVEKAEDGAKGIEQRYQRAIVAHADENVLKRILKSPTATEEPSKRVSEIYCARALHTPERAGATTEEPPRVPFPDHDARMTAVAGLLAVASGLSLVYAGDAGWGQPADYLAAFLWGAVVSEGAKWVSLIAGRKLPG